MDKRFEDELEETTNRLPTDLEGLKALMDSMREKTYGYENEEFRVALEDLEAGVLYGSYADGAGNSESLWVIPEDSYCGREIEALYTYYDHESSLNFLAEEDPTTAYELQRSIYEGVPEDLRKFVFDREIETYELFNVKSEDDSKVYAASAVLYLQHGSWKASEGFLRLLEDSEDSGGLGYYFDPELD